MAWHGSTRSQRLPKDWERRRRAVKRRAGGRCEWTDNGKRCTALGTECDHIQPGDNHDLSNLQWLCGPHHARLDRITADIGRDLAAIAARMHRLIERAAINPQPDGYPRRASGAEPSTAPTPIDPDHDGSLDYADPTGNTVTAPPTADPVSRSVNAIWRRLDSAANDLLRAAEMARELANPSGVVELEHPWCTNHWRIQRPNGERIHRELAWRRDRLRYPTLRLCSFCGEFNEAHGQLPPEDLLAHLDRHPSARLTPALIARYLGPQKDPAEPRGKRKKGWISA